MNSTLHNYISQLVAGIMSHTPGGGTGFFSAEFVVMLFLFMAVYALLYRRTAARNLWLTAAGLLLYYKANGVLLVMLLAMSLSDWVLSRFISNSGNRTARATAYIYSLVCNTGIVVWFKTIVEFALPPSGGMADSAGLVLPVGISFYLFHSVGYMTDVYFGRTKPARRWKDYLLFLSFFPVMFAGPVLRARHMLPQIARPAQADRQTIYAGLWLVLTGFLKKTVFADYLGQFNGWVFDSPASYSGLENLMALAGYSMQIFFDFSGYSDIAIGIAMMLGFDIGINFDRPYRSSSVTEFWHRWHISLSTWMRDYIYIPLGGNRRGRLRQDINLMVTMAVAGIWHGFTPLFLLWGLMHGAGIVVQKRFSLAMQKEGRHPMPSWLARVLTFGFVTLLWILFRSPSAASAATMAERIFTSVDMAGIIPFVVSRPLWCLMLAAAFATQMLPDRCRDTAGRLFVKAPLPVKIIIAIAMTQLMLQMGGESVSPFIYSAF